MRIPKFPQTKLEQANYINNFGCSEYLCIRCRFITPTCRIYKPDVSPDIKKSINQVLRKEKLFKIENM